MLRLSIKKNKGETMSSKITLTVLFMMISLFALNAVTLDGQVMAAETGEPVGNALVELRAGNTGAYETNTDEAGHFIFEELESHRYRLNVEAEGFETFMEMFDVEEDMTVTVELTTAGNPAELTGHLFGVVTYEDGEFAAGTQISIHTENPNSHPQYTSYEAVTGDDGAYDFAEIVDFAEYEVMVMSPEMPFMTEVYVEGETEFNFVIEEYIPGETYSLTGTVTDSETGEIIPEIEVILPGGQGMMQMAVSDENGVYLFSEVMEGEYELMVHGWNSGYETFNAEIEIFENTVFDIALVSENTNPGELTGHLFGVVSYEDGEFAAGQTITISSWNQNTQPHYVSYETLTLDDGSYDFAEIVDFVDYEVMVMSPEMPFMSEVYVEGETEFNFVLEEFVPGETYALSGNVTDAETGDAVADVEVVLHGMQGMMQEVVTDETGNYLFAEVFEGNYNLSVHGWNSGYEQFTTEIEIFENTVFDIALIPVEQGDLSLSGLVTDALTGDVIPGIEIVLHAGQGMNYSTESAEDGTYVIDGIFAGEYSLSAHGEEMEYFMFHADLEIAENTVFDIALEPYVTGELTLNGTITAEETGEALEGIMVHLWGENTPGNMLMGISDEAGFYQIDAIFPGIYNLIIMEMQGTPLYETEIEILENTVHDIVLGENQGSEDGSLSGNVLDAETGEMIPEVVIYLQHGWETFETISDENGYYNFQEVATGNYHVAAALEGYMQFNEMIEIDGDVELEIVLEAYVTGDFMLSGNVTDAETGEILTDVHIQLFNENGNHNMGNTDEDGNYEIDGIFAGEYQMMAWTNGWSQYEPFEIDIEILDNVVFDFVMTPIQLPGDGSISGTVYNAVSGDVIADAFIDLSSIDGGGHGGWWNHYESVTDEAGFFTFPNVEAGEYILFAGAEGYMLSFYDGTAYPEEATIIVITDDEEVVVEMNLTPLVFFTISGTVMDYVNNVPLAEAAVWAMMPGTGCNQWAADETLTDENGEYVLEVPEGEYIIAAEYGEHGNNELMRQYYDHTQSPASADVLTIDADVTGIDFDLAMPENYDNRISGTITAAGEVPENPVLVAAVSGGGNNWEAACVTDMFGNYQLNNLPEGDYFILAYEYASVPTYYPGVIDFQDAEFVTATGYVTGVDFELIMPERGGVFQVDGYVTDNNNEPVVNANVIIIDENDTVLSYAVTNSDGYYMVDGLPSGTLTGLATKVLFETDHQNINVTTAGNADFVIFPEGTTDAPEGEVTSPALSMSNYPNPFNPVTTISFELATAGFTTLDIYNIAGQKVTSLINNEVSAGAHQVIWNGTGKDGQTLSSGMYFYKLISGDISLTSKMVLMK